MHVGEEVLSKCIDWTYACQTLKYSFLSDYQKYIICSLLNLKLKKQESEQSSENLPWFCRCSRRDWDQRQRPGWPQSSCSCHTSNYNIVFSVGFKRCFIRLALVSYDCIQYFCINDLVLLWTKTNKIQLSKRCKFFSENHLSTTREMNSTRNLRTT